MLDKTSGQVMVEHGVDLSGEDGVNAVWSGSDEWAVRWDGNLERDEGAEANITFGFKEDIREIPKGVAQSDDDCRRPARAMNEGRSR